jgi:hypothetical protein
MFHMKFKNDISTTISKTDQTTGLFEDLTEDRV